MYISRLTKVVLKNLQKIGKMTHLTVKIEFSKKITSLQFFMTEGPLNLNITFLVEKLCPLA